MSGKHDPDERVALPLDPETALRALLAVDPDDEPETPSVPRREDMTPEQREHLRRCVDEGAAND